MSVETVEKIENKDCSVCEKLHKAKYKAVKKWQVACFILSIAVAILAVLYFSTGAAFQEINKYEQEVEIHNEGEQSGNNVIINGEGNKITSNATETSNMPVYILISVVIGSAILGGAIIFTKRKQ